MNCKPGQLATIVRRCRTDRCVSMRVGCPVRVTHLATPRDVVELATELFEGPVWALETPLTCPLDHCVQGLDRVPDACLKPFDPDSEPAPDEAVDLPITTPGHVPA